MSDRSTICSRLVATLVAEIDISAYQNNLKSDGSWPDINYQDQGLANWLTLVHLNQTWAMARTWGWKNGQGTTDPHLAGQVQLALGYWLDSNFKNKGNWYLNDISVPYIVGTTMLLMGNAITLTAGQSTTALAIMARRADQALPGICYAPRILTGENAVLQGKNVVIEGCLTSDDGTVSSGMKEVFDQLVVSSPSDEGIQADDSFHQHGAQLYSGGYGLQFAQDTSFMAYLARGTRYAIDQASQQVLASYMLAGQQWMTWGNLIDYGAKGRGITRVAPDTNDLPLSWACNYMAALDGPRKAEFQTFSTRIRTSDFGDTGAPVGHHGFWRSDFAVCRSNAFYASVKMVSKRTNGSESGNGEGLKNFYVSQGCTYLMRSGAEYFNIFPVWDWRRVPGVTCGQATGVLPQLGWTDGYGLTSFAGLVSDGACGGAAMHFEVLEDVPVSARKAWFYFGLELVCLGAAIQSTADDVIATSVNQCLLCGDVNIFDGTTVSKAPAGPTTSTLHWVHHYDIGYVLPDPIPVVVQAKAQTGNWHTINTSQPDAAVSKDVFSLWIEHGQKPQAATYCYVIVPGSLADVTTYASNLPVTVLSNSANLQAVRQPTSGLTQAVFHAAGSLQIDPGLSVATDQPCLLMVRQAGGLALSVSDPQQSLQQLTLSVSGQYDGPQSSFDPNTGQTDAVVQLPQGADAGQTVSLQLTPA